MRVEPRGQFSFFQDSQAHTLSSGQADISIVALWRFRVSTVHRLTTASLSILHRHVYGIHDTVPMCSPEGNFDLFDFISFSVLSLI